MKLHCINYNTNTYDVCNSVFTLKGLSNLKLRIVKVFPKVDFRGFCIFCSMKNLLSNDTKISFLQIFSRFTPFKLDLLDY